MFFEAFLGGVDQFKGKKLVTTLFETLEDFTNETTLDTIGLDHDISTFHFYKSFWFGKKKKRERNRSGKKHCQTEKKKTFSNSAVLTPQTGMEDNNN
jgi:hypothetical protein